MTQSIVLSDAPHHSGVLVFKYRSLLHLDKTIAATMQGAASVAELDPRAKCELGIGFGASFWRTIVPAAAPRNLREFTAIEGKKHKAPSTQGDIVVIANSERADLVFESLLRARRAFHECEVIEEVHGFRYLDSRDLSGFIDGTGNPSFEERPEVTLIDESDVGFTGGSFAFAQRWVHDLTAVAKMSVAEREMMMGRTLATGEELAEDVIPDDAHIKRVEIVENGEELAIHRKSFPYGTTVEHGLMFLAFTKDPAIIVKMLERMYGITDGMTDRMLAFSRPVSGGFYFMPSKSGLLRLGRAG